MSIEVKNYRYWKTSGKHIESGVKVALVKTGSPKWMPILMMDGALTVRKVPASDIKHMTELRKHGIPYPLKLAVRHFRHYGKAHGMSKNAKRFLREASSIF